MHLSLAATFSVLVLLKHLFAPLAPIVAAYLIKAYCIQCAQCNRNGNGNGSHMGFRFCVGRLLQLGGIAILALLVAFLPFVMIVAPASAPAQSLLHSVRSLELLTFEQGGGQLQWLLPFVPSKCILDWEYSVGEWRANRYCHFHFVNF